jgi:hypothetical protein
MVGSPCALATAVDLRLQITGFAFAPGRLVFAAAGASVNAASLPVGGRGVLRSDDGGRSWQNVSAGLANLDVSGLAVAPGGSGFASTIGGGVYRLDIG